MTNNAVNVMDGTACCVMLDRNGDPRLYNIGYWKKEFLNVDSVQTNVRAQIGCGTPIIVNFFAPLNVNKYDEPCVYDFRSLGEDEELIRG